MTLTSIMVHSVTVVRAGTATDRYGNAEKDWTNATHTHAVAWIAQRNASEVLGNREAQVGQWVGYFPEGVPIAGGDRVEWGDYTFEVDGPPHPAWSPRGPHHIEAQLLLVEG